MGSLSLILFVICAKYSVQTPIQVEEVNFVDPWEYRLEPHNEPLLITKSQHNLPVLVKRMSKHQDIDFEEYKDQFEELSKKKSIGSRLTCAACRLGVSLLRAEVVRGGSFEEIKDKFVAVCVGLNIQTETVCSGIFDIYGPVVLPALKISKLSSEQLCKLLLEEKCGLVENPTHDWNIELSPKPDNDIWEKPSPKEGLPVFKVLQLSDTHFDPDYQEGSPANCNEPLCCRNYSTPNKDEPLVSAGKWGTFGQCDTPKILFENMLKNIVKEHPDIDYVIWTGDIPPHDIWNQTKEQNLENIRFTIGKIVETFPDIPIFPALGNHESTPEGNFAPPWVKSGSQSIDWLYNEVAQEWAKWLPSEVNETLLHGGFYSVLIRPKFRLISLNMNYCYSRSWWLLLNSTDPAKELKWLIHELDMAEEKDEKVHIIGHIPPGDSDCLKMWSKNYYDVINRYHSTVVAQFFGHTHNDEFEVFYADDDTRNASAVAYVGPVVTTYEVVNPAYRIYYVDGDHENSTREVIDHETWIMELARANENPDLEPEWIKLYSARAAYGMSTLRPAEWAKLIELMVSDPKVFNQFYRFYYTGSPAAPPCTENKCIYDKICALKSGKSHSKSNLCIREEEKFMNLS